MKKFIWSILNTLRLGGAVQLLIAGYLKENGWFRSFHTKRSVDANNHPIPWITYPCIHFLEGRLAADMTVFEYGAGNSTRWYAQRVLSVISVENDQGWVQLLEKQGLPANANLLYRELGNGYAEAIKEYTTGFDMVVVDGRSRNACLRNSLDKLTERGIILFDNTDRSDYQESYDLLKNQGFKRIDFWGLSPIVPILNCTTLFYRKDNVLGI